MAGGLRETGCDTYILDDHAAVNAAEAAGPEGKILPSGYRITHKMDRTVWISDTATITQGSENTGHGRFHGGHQRTQADGMQSQQARRMERSAIAGGMRTTSTIC